MIPPFTRMRGILFAQRPMNASPAINEIQRKNRMSSFNRILGLWLVALGFGPMPAQAQIARPPGYAAKPVRMLVAYPAGGSADLMTRVLAQKLGESLGQQVVVDNRPGAAGNIGVEVVAKSPADG